MRDSQHDGQIEREGDGVSALAAEVLARLVARDGKTGRVLSETMMDKLTLALLGPDAGALGALRPDLRRHRITDADLVDHYFPELARRLGYDWEMDHVSFASLSIAVARLQSALREIGAGWAGDEADGRNLATLLLIVPQDEDHTFGAMTVLAQLRRRGISVSLRIAPDLAEVGRLLRQRSFDAAMLSVGCRENLVLCRDLVTTLHTGAGGRMRVAVGGAALLTGVDARAATGADVATNDLTAALAELGLAVSAGVPELAHG